ncbi:MAG: GMC family oxidoreductase [Deltaproteobacteria bacterium]|nr:MAG: GMC family oxidoreductase [Deltaproteobacteria bacterium]
MGVSFFETMRGSLVDGGGVSHALEFCLKAEATSFWRFLADGRSRASGVLFAPPWATDLACAGDLTVELPRGRKLVYALDFSDSDGIPWRLSGHKTWNPLHPVRSLTELPLTLARAAAPDVVVARGVARFDLATLPEFLRSWSPLARFGRHALGPRWPRVPTETAGFSERFRATFHALAEAELEPGEHVPGADERTDAFAREILDRGDAPTVMAYAALLLWLDGAALLHERRAFRALDVASRRRLLSHLARTPGSGALDLLRARLVAVIGFPLRAAHFDRPEYLNGIGHPTFEAAPRPQAAPPRWVRQVTPAEALAPVADLEADVVVIGTGAGGAPLAATLAQAGLAVALIEEGRTSDRHDYAGGPVARMDRMWRRRGLDVTVGATLAIPTGRVVGGTTVINSGTCFPTPDAVLTAWQRELGFPEDFAPDRWSRHLERARAALQVTPAGAREVGAIGDVVARGADALGFEHGPLPRNAPGCTGAGTCIFGCPEGAKRSADVAYVPRALDAGAALFTGLPATRLLMRGDRVVAVEARGADRHGVAKTLRIYASEVVVAAGALQSPLLLRDNGLRLPGLGRNLSVHPAMGLVARLPAGAPPLRQWASIPQGYGMIAPGLTGVRFEGFYLPPQLLAGFLPMRGGELTRWMDDFERVAQFGFMVRDGGDGSVHRGPGGRPLIRYRLSARSRARLARGAGVLSEVLLRGGAEEVLTGVLTHPRVRTAEEARALRGANVPAGAFTLLGCHPLGTCAMGADPRYAVVDFDHRVHGTDNLYVVDGSTVPTSLGVNPQMTIMAFAFRAAERMIARLERRHARAA